jgi:hypothetical protein
MRDLGATLAVLVPELLGALLGRLLAQVMPAPHQLTETHLPPRIGRPAIGPLQLGEDR